MPTIPKLDFHFNFWNVFKVSYPPFLLELFLAHPVKYEATKCTVIDNELIFEICKEEAKEWDSLEMKLTKEEKLEMKTKMIEKSQTEAIKRGSLKTRECSFLPTSTYLLPNSKGCNKLQ